jgi:hypothetical protein
MDNLKNDTKLSWLRPTICIISIPSFYLTTGYFEKAKCMLTSPKKIGNYSLYEEGMAALVLNRFGEQQLLK